MLWPRIVYWAALAVTLVGLFYAITGYNLTPAPDPQLIHDLTAKSATTTGAAGAALLGPHAVTWATAWWGGWDGARGRAPGGGAWAPQWAWAGVGGRRACTRSVTFSCCPRR